MKVAIIGASGLLGGHLIEAALRSGHEILAIARSFPQRSAAFHFREQIRLLPLDASVDLSAQHLSGVDALINVAAIVSAEQDQGLIDKNLALTKHIFSSAQAAGCKQLVQVSSVATMASGNQNLISEKDHGSFRNTPYAESKFRADEWLAQNFSSLLTIHPCYMLGRWDAKPSSGAILLALQLKRLKGFTSGVKNFVHASDVAEGIFLALGQKASGHYLLGGENLSLETFLTKSLKALNLSSDLRPLTLEDFNENPSLKEFFLANPVNDEKARKDWGYRTIRSIDAALDETVAYFREFRLLPRVKS